MANSSRKIKLNDRIQSTRSLEWFFIKSICDESVNAHKKLQGHPLFGTFSFSYDDFFTEAEVRDFWQTPKQLASNLVERYGLEIDVASSNENKVCELNFNRDDDALIQNWDKNSWCNPPYSDILPWVKKALASPVTTVMLLPMRTASPWFRALTNDVRVNWYAFKGRVAFTPPPGVKPSSPRHDSGLFVINDEKSYTGGFRGILDPKTGEQVQ